MPRLLVAAAVLGLALPAAAQPPPSQVGSFLADAGPVGIYPVADGLMHPWGMAVLPDGRMLVTERAGRLRIVDPSASGPPATVSGTPTVYAQGQGGLLDVALAPDFAETGHVYLSFARPGPGGQAATALGRGVLRGDSLAAFETLFTQEPYVEGPAHFGSRIVFSPDGHLFLAMGERFQFDPAQDLGNHLGTVVRLNPDGSVPDDNPFTGDASAQDEIWSYGHRNIQAAAFDPTDGRLYVAEMGPLGGDELNVVERGANYGWPVVSWGMDYDGELIPDPPTRPEFEDAVVQWTPTIAPSGMVYYTGAAFPEWQGSFFIGSLVYQGLVRVRVEGGEVAAQQILPLGARIREVEQGPDGTLFVLTDKDDGDVWQLRPIETRRPENE
ncbi:PQQ-dependent sugar dehydrogenase [Rubrivirga sp.]|uniref:PQQ-dependent sugar dehydrogenase n=1 Tax=Rubrivirga sp. TaxID=1885344 RepID=UPI003B51D074